MHRTHYMHFMHLVPVSRCTYKYLHIWKQNKAIINTNIQRKAIRNNNELNNNKILKR